jgi:tryptophan-rich sensory protein
VLQLVLNFTWSWLFFGAHRMGWALVEIVVLWLTILLTTVLFARRSVTAAALLVPYLAWVAFATALNAALWHLNS